MLHASPVAVATWIVKFSLKFTLKPASQPLVFVHKPGQIDVLIYYIFIKPLRHDLAANRCSVNCAFHRNPGRLKNASFFAAFACPRLAAFLYHRAALALLVMLVHASRLILVRCFIALLLRGIWHDDAPQPCLYMLPKRRRQFYEAGTDKYTSTRTAMLTDHSFPRQSLSAFQRISVCTKQR